MTLGECLPTNTGGEVDDLIDQAHSWLPRDLERCRVLVERAEAGLNGQRDPARLARLDQVRGELAVACGDLGAAASAFRAARRNWLAAGERFEAVRAATGSIEVRLLVGEFRDAETALRRVQTELHRLTEHDACVARLGAIVQRQLADAQAGQGQITAALRQYGAVENLFAALGDADNIALVQLRRGIAALDLGLTHNALLELNRARTAYEGSGQRGRAAMATVLVAEAFSATGQVARALEVLDCVAAELPETPWHVAFHALARSGALLRSGFAAEAHAEARAAEEVFVQIGAVELSARAALASARASLAWGKHRAAAAELQVAERLFGECGSRLMQARTWLIQAEVAWAAGDDQGCRAACDRVLDAETDDTPPEIGVHARLAAARAVDADAASVLLQEADQLAARVAIPELHVDVLLARARHERRDGQVPEAIDTLHRALNVGSSWASRLGQRESILCPSLTQAGEELILLLLERGDHAGRVEALRRARAVKLARAQASLRRRPVDDGRSAEERRLRLDRLLSDTLAPVVVRAIEAEDILPAIPYGSLLEFYVAGDDVLVFVARDGHVDARVLPRAAESTRRLINAWQQECTLMAPGLRDRAGFTSSAALDGLFDLLLAPVLDLLADLDGELQVVGHRHLDAVPFDALLDEVGPWYAHLDRPVPALDPHSAGRIAPELRTVVLAAADESAPLIADEAEMILRVLPRAEVLVGTAATKDALARHASGADVVHLACHGVFRPDDPLSSGLRLADGWLHARDIANGAVDLAGAIVVLSACSSGRSADYTAEPVGLASACLSAGARGVVAALWAVDDQVTLELMTSFYRALADGSEPQVALRRARRQLARRYPHPYYWGAFRFVGGGSQPQR